MSSYYERGRTFPPADCLRRSCGLKGRTAPCSSPECSLKEHFSPPIDTDFYYFKPSGKWKYHGEGTWPKFVNFEYTHKAIADANNGRMPGITSDGTDMAVVCIPRQGCEHPCAFPIIVRAEGDA